MSIADSVCYLHVRIKFTLEDSETMDEACEKAQHDSYSDMLPHMLGLARVVLILRNQGSKMVLLKDQEVKQLDLNVTWLQSTVTEGNFPSTLHLSVSDYEIYEQVKKLFTPVLPNTNNTDSVLLSSIFKLYAHALRDYCSGDWEAMIESDGQLKSVKTFKASR